MRMPFGRYRGVEVADLDDGYLSWVRNLDDLREPLRSAVEAEWQARFEPILPPPHSLSCDTRQMAAEIIAAGYRHLTKLHHPDHGGATKTMQLVNDAAARLRQMVRSA